MKNIKKIIRSTKNLRLLYVEDNYEARVSTLEILKDFFENIVVAVDGEDGLEKFTTNDIDLVITDINMPKMNGLDMLKKIKEIDANMVCFIFSAYTESDYFVKSIKIGVEGYILKPIEYKQFIVVLRKAIEKIDALKNRVILDQYKELVDLSSIFSIIATDGKIIYVNDAFCAISEYDKEELIGKDYHQIMLFELDEATKEDIRKSLKEEKKVWQGIVKNISKTGRTYYLDSTIKPIVDEKGKVIEYIALRYDVSAIMSPLRQLEDFIESTQEPMLMLIMIEDFEDIVNFYTQKALREIENSFAKELHGLLPKEFSFEKIFSLGNGEYAFCQEKNLCQHDEESIVNFVRKYQRVVEEAHINVGEVDFDITILVSLSYGREVLENARYGLKQLVNRKDNFIIANDFANKEHLQAEQNLKVLKMVKTAIETNNIISYFQPIVDNQTKEIKKYESLVRLVDGQGNVISPLLFLDIAKKGKYYNKITGIVLDNSFKALMQTRKVISMNISALDIEKRSTREKIYSLLEDHKEEAHRVVLELLEDEEVKNFELIEKFILKVKSYGVRIAIDDFGSGYSNFERLLSYHPDIVKIDGSIVKKVLIDDFSLSIVKTIVNFTNEQNLEIIAEYVENEEIYNLLTNLGIKYSQGYYFGEPKKQMV